MSTKESKLSPVPEVGNKKEMHKEGLNTNGVSKIVLCSEYLKRTKHCRIAWLNNYYKSIVDAEKAKKSFEEQYQELSNKCDKNDRR